MKYIMGNPDTAHNMFCILFRNILSTKQTFLFFFSYFIHMTPEIICLSLNFRLLCYPIPARGQPHVGFEENKY